MLRLCYRPLEICFGRRRRRDELLWHLDLKPHANGDFSIAVVQANSSLEDQSQVLTSPSATYIGVYDGHGGPEASRFINKNLFPHLQKMASEQGGLSADVIKKAFNATEEEFLRFVKRSWPARPQMASVGSCCLVGAISNDILYVANLGDSRAVLGKRLYEGRKKPVVAERLSTDHNVAVEEIRKEVEALHPDDSHIVVYTRGVWRIKGIIQEAFLVGKGISLQKWFSPVDSTVNFEQFGGCWGFCGNPQFTERMSNAIKKLKVSAEMVSRSIGDMYLKKPEFHRDPLFQQFGAAVPLKRPVMTAEPSILTRKIKPQDLFLIFASDGLWEQLSDEEAVDIVFKNPRAGIAKRLVRAAIQEAAKKREMRYDDIKVIEKGVRRHFHDDITVVVIYLDHHNGSRRDRFKEQNTDDCTSSPVDIYSLNAEDVENPVHNAT